MKYAKSNIKIEICKLGDGLREKRIIKPAKQNNQILIR
jgi:hypothetical protein